MPKPKRNPPKPPTKKQSKSPEKSAEPTSAPAPERSRATDDALPLRVAVLEDVMKRAHVQLARRLDDLEKRLPAPS